MAYSKQTTITMTPEEKQAIINKALELGFRYYPSKKSMFKNLINTSTLILWVQDLELRVSQGMNDSPIKTIASPAQLETLFNAITK